MPGCANVRVAVVFVAVGMFAGTPAACTNVTLWLRVPMVHVTDPPFAIVTVVGLKMFAVDDAVTSAVAGGFGAAGGGESLKHAASRSGSAAEHSAVSGGR